MIVQQILPASTLGCIANGMENMHTDVKVLLRDNSAPEIVNSIGEIERKFLKHYTLNETLLWMLVATAMKTSVKQQ